ncbi:uncharacterized protein Gasu_55880 [Galdieria sulphuraria]|uniref:C2 domain-containing protein n=1 Tax=Galdieria sulphuraria TaxID=130081 RepID=M2VUD3_GALSU|nr:uncharacterized protein Gasu_55880 [Galdieria sulphuraria]EME26796.1 hypothetical protein Gasu_55880 [Galdieria sulphuraria]|eukprot:XP_005703316.1 hypothetical protein Gasu_55880 [Galdieria sulphuraria]
MMNFNSLSKKHWKTQPISKRSNGNQLQILSLAIPKSLSSNYHFMERKLKFLFDNLQTKLFFLQRELDRLWKEQPLDPLYSKKQPFFPQGFRILVLSFCLTILVVKFAQLLYDWVSFILSIFISVFHTPRVGKNKTSSKVNSNIQMNNNTTRFRNDSFTRVSTIQQEKETVEWLNASLKRCWKLFNDILQPEAMKILQKVIQDALEEERRPLLQSIDVESFELGGRSPLIFGVEALPTRSDTELVYEFDFRYDGDAKLLLLVRIGPFRRFCLHIPVIVSGLDVDATFRVHLRLTQEKPFIGDISLALVRQPRLSLVLKPFKIVDIMEVPGLRVFLRRLLTVEIPKRMVLPNRLIVFKLQPDSNIKRSILKKLSKKKKDYVGVVNILLYGAVSLVGTTTLGLSNPFCRITVADNTTRSKSDKNTSELGRKGDPVWNQQFEMLVRDPENDSILFEVMDRYGMRYRTIGTFEVMISSLVEGKNTELWVPLQESVGSDGRLHVSLYYRNFVDDISLFSESVDALYMNENEYSDGNASEALDKDIIEKNDGSLNEESNATTINGSI